MSSEQLPHAPLSPSQRSKALRLAKLGVRRIDICRCLNLSKDEFGLAIKGDRELIVALNEPHPTRKH